MLPRHPLLRHPNGRIQVDQGREGSLFLSFNPDDERFYVSRDESTAETIATFAGNPKGWANAIQFARRKSAGQAT
jgi:hypothetical protein